MSNEIELKAGVEIVCNKCGAKTNPPITNKDLEDNELISFICSGCGATEEIASKKIIDMVKEKAIEVITKQFNKHFI